MIFLALILLIPISALIGGASLDIWWSWFIQPVFPAAPDLTLATAIGVAFVVSFLTQSATVIQDDTNAPADPAAQVARSVGKGGSYYIVMWILALTYHFLFGIGA